MDLVKFYFLLGSIALFLLIILLDKLINKLINKKSTSSPHAIDSNQKELAQGLQSLQRALEDNIINDEEYEKYKADLLSKYQ